MGWKNWNFFVRSLDRTSATVGPLSTDVEWEAKVSRKVWAHVTLGVLGVGHIVSGGPKFDELESGQPSVSQISLRWAMGKRCEESQAIRFADFKQSFSMAWQAISRNLTEIGVNLC